MKISYMIKIILMVLVLVLVLVQKPKLFLKLQQYLKFRYSLKGNVIHDQDNTNGTGTLDQTVSETTTSKMRSGVCHYHFQNFSNRGGPLLTYNN